MKRALVIVAIVVVAVAVWPGAMASAQTPLKRWMGYLGDGSGRAYQFAGQGGLHKLMLTDGKGASRRSRRYRVCLRGGATPLRECFTRRLRYGYDEFNVSRLVNDRGGPGHYRAAWYVGGSRVATWRFHLESEGV